MNMQTQPPQTQGTQGDTAQREKELDAYEKLRIEVKKILGQALDAVSADNIKSAVESATKRLKEAGEYTGETVSKVSAALKKDLASSYQAMKPQAQALGETAGGVLEVWRDKGGKLLAQAAKALGEWSSQFSNKLDALLVYHTGDITHGGEFACANCQHKVTVPKTGHLPPCPTCLKTEFRRVK
ncbi:MAG: zinc ribbon-containing protein [Gammaproteobacteria bacterium]|nr:zinc ribbon-containing protein [Gammaproteobacteria bacterium]